MTWQIVKLLFIYIYIFFLFELTTRKEYGKVSHDNVTHHGHMSGCYRVISYNKCEKVVYRLCSSCISSIQNLIETLLI